ncbi:hypothetical protein Tco_0428628 [Tanacetum coccineum]
MHSDELYKFSDGTLTRLLSSLEDITKNIDMTYFLKRRCSTLEKKRAHFMIKDINKLLKERRMMRSLEKFIGERFDTLAGNPVKEILLKLSLPDHRIFKDGGEALGWHLEEIHMTWAHLGKKRTRLQLYAKVEEEKCIQTLETASQFIATTSEVLKDGVRNFVTASERNRLKEALEQSAERRHKDYKAMPSC